MQQALGHIGYGKRNAVKEKILEIHSFDNFDLLPVIRESIGPQALRYEGEPLPSIWALSHAAPHNRGSVRSVIQVGSFSKVLMPGLRLGWIVAPEPVINQLVLAKQAADLHTSTLNQYLALELLKAHYLEEITPELIHAYRTRRDTMLAALHGCFPSNVKWTRPQGGMFLLVTLPAGMDAGKLLPRALERKVAYVPGEEFHADGSGKNTLRLNFSNATPERISEGIARLAAVFQETRSTNLD